MRRSMTEQPFEPMAIDLRHYVDFDLQSPSGRRAISTDVMALDVICLQPQQIIEVRTFETADAVYTVLGGTAWVVTDQTEVTLSPLQAVLIPAGIPHGLKNTAADPLILQVLTSPPDEIAVLPPGPVPEAAAEQAHIDARPSLTDRLRRTLGTKVD